MFNADSIEIARLKSEDIATIALIEKKCLSQEAWSAKQIEETVFFGGIYFVASVLGEIAGHIGMTFTALEGYIINIAVLPEFRRRGIATALVNQLCKYCRENRGEFLSLEVRSSNLTAVNVYKSCGFKVVGERKNFYIDPPEAALLMTMYFDYHLREHELK